jgi:chromosome segregation ATPase
MGINREQVFEACEQIFSQGKTPRIEAIRTLLGSGSYSTIGKHLREWKEQAPERLDATQAEIPPEVCNAGFEAFKSVIALIWDKASESVDSERIKTLESENERFRDDLVELAGLRTTNKSLLAQVGELNQKLALASVGVGVEEGQAFQKLQKQRDALLKERDQLLFDSEQLTQQLNEVDNNVAVLSHRVESLESERQSLQQQNKELKIANAQVEDLQARIKEKDEVITHLRSQVPRRGIQPLEVDADVNTLTCERNAAMERVKTLEAELEAFKQQQYVDSLAKEEVAAAKK